MDDMHKFICIGVSVQNNYDSPQAKWPKEKSQLFDQQKISFYAHNMDVMFEDVQECMDFFIDLHGSEEKIYGFLFIWWCSWNWGHRTKEAINYEWIQPSWFYSSRRGDFSWLSRSFGKSILVISEGGVSFIYKFKLWIQLLF